MMNKLILEKRLLISIVGCLDALACKCISISESESYIFSPRIIKIMDGLDINPNIIIIIEKGCELEDIDSLLPKELMTTICDLKNEAINLLMEYKTIDNVPWINLYDFK